MKSIITCLLLVLALALSAEDATSIILQSYTYESEGNYTQAIQEMNKLVAMDARDTFYQLRLGWLHYYNGSYSLAEKHYQKAAKLNPCLEALEGMMLSVFAVGNWSQTIEYASRILDNYPNNFTALTRIGYSYYMQQQYDKAAEFYKKAHQIYPYHIEVIGYYLSASSKSGDRDTAEILYTMLKKYSPTNTFVTEYETSRQ